MALTHHCVCRYARARRYCVLGDDVFIVGEKQAQRYKETMAKLGVELSPAKSIVPNTKYPHASAGEFAKRLFINGREVTPIPSKLIAQAKRVPELYVSLLQWCSEHGYYRKTLSCHPVPPPLHTISKLFRPKEV